MHILEHEAPGLTLPIPLLTTRDPRDLLESGGTDLAIGYFAGVLAEIGAIHLQEDKPRSLSDFGSLGYKPTAAVHFHPAFCTSACTTGKMWW